MELSARFAWLSVPAPSVRTVPLPAVATDAAFHRCTRCGWLDRAERFHCDNCGELFPAHARTQVEHLHLPEPSVRVLLRGEAFTNPPCGVPPEQVLRPLRSLDYQARAVLRFVDELRGRALWIAEPGVGLRCTAALALRELHERNAVQRSLVLCTPSLVTSWVSRLRERTGVVAEAIVRTKQLEEVSCAVCPWTVLEHATDEQLQSMRWDCVLLDGTKGLTAPRSKRLRLLKRLASPYLLVLTGSELLAKDPAGKALRTTLGTLVRPGVFDDTNEQGASLRAAFEQVLLPLRRQQAIEALPTARVAQLTFAPTAKEVALEALLLKERKDLLSLEPLHSSPAALCAALQERKEKHARTYRAQATGVVSSRVLSVQAQCSNWDAPVCVCTQFTATEQEARALLSSEKIQVFGPDASLDALRSARTLVHLEVPWDPRVAALREAVALHVGRTEPLAVVWVCAEGGEQMLFDRYTSLLGMPVHELDALLLALDGVAAWKERIAKAWGRAAAMELFALSLRRAREGLLREVTHEPVR